MTSVPYVASGTIRSGRAPVTIAVYRAIRENSTQQLFWMTVTRYKAAKDFKISERVFLLLCDLLPGRREPRFIRQFSEKWPAATAGVAAYRFNQIARPKFGIEIVGAGRKDSCFIIQAVNKKKG